MKWRAALVKNLIVLLLIEAVVRGAVGLGLLSLPPSDVNAFDRTQFGENPPAEKRLYESDRNLLFRMRANARIVYPRTALYAGRPQTYEVRTNDRGFRTPPFSTQKPPGVFRIVCLGDSSTFGLNVEAADAYPQVLARLLEERYPGRFQVLNLGVPGYSSRQGLELLRRQVLDYKPDLVTFAFGLNDRFWPRPLSDDVMIRLNQSAAGRIILAVRTGLDHVYTYRLLKRGLTYLMQHVVDVGKLENSGPPRVSLEGIRDNIAAAHSALAPRGTTLLVLNNDFYGTDARQGILMGVREAQVPYLDDQDLFIQQQARRSAEIEAASHLPPETVPPGQALFRVRVTGQKQQVVLQTGGEFDGQLVRAPMRDDGKEGDQVAGDGIWSVLVPASAGSRLSYNYFERVGGDLVKEYRDTSFGGTSRLRTIEANAAGPIDTFGTVYLHSDTSHPDEEGYRLIAQHILQWVLANSQR